MAADYTPNQVKAQLLQGDVQLLDVRQQHEYDAGRISGAKLIPLSELAAGAQELDKERPVIVYCRSGGRSAMAATALEQAGFEVHNMTGGLLAWSENGLELEPEGGEVAEP
ncbi:MAG: rhodanese-like domain-containing protein [Solirubrobacterales bacterium]|nr:rhodanese-like domain-containing protein [Solirubrobacterales bacterium]